MRLATLLLPVLALAPAAAAQDKTSLAPGDPAPVYDISNWVKGDQVAAFQPGQYYVLEFWATWCGPCKKSMPHLTELQKEYAGKVTFIGVSDEKLDTVTKFLGQPEWAEKTQYTLATDPDRSVYKSYMTAAGQNGIPTAFVIGTDGKVQYIGHPMTLDKVLPGVVNGTWNVDGARKGFELESKLDDINGKMATAKEEDQKALLEQMVDVMSQMVAANEAVYGQYRVQQFHILAEYLDRSKDAYALAPAIMKASWDDAMTLNEFAWSIVDPEGKIQERDLDVALRSATRACELTEYKDGNILDTLARVYFLKGELKKAVEMQQKAVDNATDENTAAQLKARLAEYQKALGVQP